jgi:hypothetical protein
MGKVDWPKGQLTLSRPAPRIFHGTAAIHASDAQAADRHAAGRGGSMRQALRGMLCGIAFSLALAGCASVPETRANYDTTVDFAQFRTFGYFEKLGTDENGYESLVTQQLKASTRREMEARGYRYAGTGADLLVNFNASLQQQTRVHQTYDPYWYGGGYYGYRYGYYGGWGGYNSYVDQYVEGTLNIDIVDAKRKQLVWEGVTVGRVTEKVKNDRAAAIDAAVRDMFTKYPFRAGGAQ